ENRWIISQIAGRLQPAFVGESRRFERADHYAARSQWPLPQRLVMHVAMHRHGLDERQRIDPPADRRDRLAVDRPRAPRERQVRTVDARLPLEAFPLEALPQRPLELDQ